MHRAFHAYPKDFKTSKGVFTNAIYGFNLMFLNYIKKLNPTHIVIAFEDDSTPTFRETMYTAYKKNRTWKTEKKEEAEVFFSQIPKSLEILKAFNVKILNTPGYEADDIVGSLCAKLPKETKIIILSNDFDLCQLISFNVRVLRPAKPPFIKEKLYDLKVFSEHFDFAPNLIPDYKGLRGDPSDNIKGVYGIGEKTAKSLIQAYGNIEGIYGNLSKIKSARIKHLLEESAEEAFLSKKLAIIETGIGVSSNLVDYKFGDFDKERVLKIYKALEFTSLEKRFNDLFAKPVVESKNSDQISLF